MVASVSSTTATASLYNIGNVTNKNTAVESKNNNQDDAVEFHIPDIDSIDDFYKCCSSLKDVNSLESYTSNRICSTYDDKLKNVDYKAEFQGYLQSRGCENTDELKALNTTNLKTKKELIDYSVVDFDQITTSLYDKGFTSGKDDISRADLTSLMSNANLQDVADFYNAPGATLKEYTSKFQKLIDKLSTQDNIDDDLKAKLTSRSQEITNSFDAITELSDKMEKENEASKNVQKYNSNLIASYQD